MMELYPYQKRVKDLLQGGRSVVLQAPTGAGKTLAAMAPFIEAFFDLPDDAFPKQCVYSVPMRVLASQFEAEYAGYAASYRRRFHRDIQVKIQTGERPEDGDFLGDLIFATIDQSLSSALGVPYSLTPGLANRNAGAFFSSYLVFDEFHLFPVSAHGGATGALVTTLQLLQAMQGVVPFVLMTATFSSTMLDELARRLGAAVVTVSPDEYAQIASGKGKTQRRRFYHVHEEVLTADAVLQAHHSPGVSRSLVICNQVGRAQALYQALRDHPERGAVEVRLLHSRFTQEDRRRKETEIAREFGREREKREQESMILVATQVVEVGLNITCDRLHTEIAPANAVLQRAGRCARYPGEEGHVHIYRVPEREGRDGSEPKPDFLPYPSDLCQAAWTSFTARDGQEIDFQTEQQIVDEVHTESDRQLLEAMDRQRGAIWSQIYAAMEGHDPSQRQDLIRHIDSITVLAAATPEAVGNPFRGQGFSFHRGSVFGLWSALQREREENWEGDEFEEEPWLMALPQVSEPDPETPGAQPEVHWLEVSSQDLLTTTNVVVLNSRFCAYDDEVGFRIVAPEAANGWQSQPGEWSQGNRGRGYRYALESYEEHIGRMAAIYRQRFQARYAYVGRRLAEGSDAQSNKLEQAVHLALACHDAAKMEQRWQRWVRRYQERIGKPIPEPDFMAVHTDFDPTDPAHVQAKKETDREVRRPPHAGESAVATARPIAELLADPPLARAVLTAIARHHSPGVSTFKPFRLHPAAAETLRRAIQKTGLPLPSKPITMEDKKGGPLDRILIEPGDFQQLCFYFYVVRALRLCDGMSQE